jgi:D-sedoheptulose 7-phosphate isomerase
MPAMPRDELDRVRREFDESIAVKRMWSDELVGSLVELARLVGDAFRGQGKVVLLGNGGSAADAQPIAAELVGRDLRDRDPLGAMVLHGNTSALTAIANDYEWETVFERQVQAWVEPQDVVIGISTSGNSANVLRGLAAAGKRGAFAAALTGEGGGQCAGACDLLSAIPSRDIPRIQESHITFGHIPCGLMEESLASI